MADGELTSGQVRRLLPVAAFAVLMVVAVGLAMRREASGRPFATPAPAAAGQSADGRSAEDAAVEKKVREWLSDADPWYSRDANRLNKAPGEFALLESNKSDVRVAAVRATAGAAACADGPLVTVDLLVRPVAGADTLTPDSFVLLASDGSVAAPIPGCSTGFAGAAEQRTLVFAAEGPDRLIVGTDPVDPEVAWHLG